MTQNPRLDPDVFYPELISRVLRIAHAELTLQGRNDITGQVGETRKFLHDLAIDFADELYAFNSTFDRFSFLNSASEDASHQIVRADGTFA